MNDTTGKSASSLAITEKKPHHRPGGCVGIFFQLFDWNRRFAKKKLFPKKLLPPVRTKQSSKRFSGDEKLPKLRLISNENSGGFPNVKKNGPCNYEQNHEMRAPGLVARLMGLESMPAVKSDNLTKASFSGIGGGDRGEKFVSNNCCFGREDLNVEKVGGKNESRPQKIQKTGPSERRAVTRFGAEALQLRNVLSRSRKHHPKLTSPVKSPRNVSGRHSSRLIGAATRILEPGLQNRNRAKCALTYSTAMHHVSVDEAMLEGRTTLSPDLSNNSTDYVSAAKPIKGVSTCGNCGHLVDAMDARTNVEEQPSVSAPYVPNCVNLSSKGIERNMIVSPISFREEERDGGFQNDRVHSKSWAAQEMDNIRSYSEPISDRKPLNQEDQIQWHSTSQQWKPQKNVSPSIVSKHGTQRRNQESVGRDRVPPRSKLSEVQSNRISSAAKAINETKDFVSLNRNSSSHSRSRMTTKVDNFKCTERRIGIRQNDSLSSERTRRAANTTRLGESYDFVSSNLGKQTSVTYDKMTVKEMGRSAHTLDRSCIKNRLPHLGESNRTGGSGNKDNDVISFTFSSPMKQKTGIPSRMQKRKEQNNSNYSKTLPEKKLEEIDGKGCFKKPLILQGDSLGALLEQKLKELTSQEEDELSVGRTQPKRTTAMILQELISALTVERPFPQDNVNVPSNKETVSSYRLQLSNANTPVTFQAKVKPNTARASVGYSHDGDHLSPGSVLEASFSNESCLSSSRDDSSWHRPNAESMERSNEEPKPLEPDAELLDSASSLSLRKSGRELITDYLGNICEVFCSINLAVTGLKGSKLTYVKEVILNAELIFRNSVPTGSDINKVFSISCFFLDELETLENVLRTNFSSILGFDDTKEGTQLKGFTFDCLVEYLDSRYGSYSRCGYKGWTRLPMFVNTEMLLLDCVDEIRRWTDLAGLIPDELIEKEMSQSLGKWTDFEIETFETGAEIDNDLLQILLNEIVIDLWAWNCMNPV